MVTLEIRFAGGRYHATPWNHHVNEGVVEWPPSPHRIIRALLSTWHLKARDEISEATIRRLCEALASKTPIYRLPTDVTPAHTRHYMPVRVGNTTKVFDAFVQLDPESVLEIAWPELVLEGELRDALAVLADRLSYLGRAESWIEARLCATAVERPNAAPAEMLGEGEGVSVLCTLPATDYARWREAEIDRQLTLRLGDLRRKAASKGKPIEKVKLAAKDRTRVEAAVPADLFRALHVDTNFLRKAGWNAPPGTRWIGYRRPTLRQPTPRIELPHREPPIAARFAVSGSVLPLLTDAVRLAEAVRGLLTSIQPLPVFLGKDESGRPLEGHEHAMYLSESHDPHGKITHLSLFAKAGLNEPARRAIDRLTSGEVRLTEGAAHPLKLTLIGMWDPEELGVAEPGDTSAPLFADACHWTSLTPFIPTRHAKRSRKGEPKLDPEGRWIGSPEHDLRRLLELANLPSVPFDAGPPVVVRIEKTEGAKLGDRLVRWLDFYRWRRRGRGARAGSVGFGFSVEFDRPVRGPIAVGYGAHFGLGLFHPIDP